MSRVLPILFNTEMVQAILDGGKTVTRRICKDGNDYMVPDMDFYDADRRSYAVHEYADKAHTDKLCLAEYNCPICPGDILYVRETWAFWPCIECMDEESCNKPTTTYKDKESVTEGCYIYRADHPHPERITWRPSIHMPKVAARIWLRVTDVHPQRLQEMTMDDFAKEGVTPEGGEECKCAWEFDGCREDSCTNRDAYLRNRYMAPFADLWNSTIPKDQLDIYSWAANPWVWVIEFEQCEKPESEG